MKNLLTVAMATLFLLIVSCSSEENDYTIDQAESVDLASDIYQESNIGIYNGIFTTLDGEQRGSVEVIIPVDNSRNASVILSLASGEIISLLTNDLIQKGLPIDNITFGSDTTGLTFSVDADGKNPIVTNVLLNYLEAGIMVRKHTSKAPVVPIAGTYSCADCADHPVLGTGVLQTFNILMFTTPDGDSGFDTQVTMASNIFNGTGSQNNCAANGTETTCDISGAFDVSGNPITWSGNHTFNNEASGMQDCSGVSGTWTFTSPTYSGPISGTFESNDSCSPNVTIYSENFDGFTGAGFAPSPGAGQLDSDIIIVNGLSDGDITYGETGDSGDFSRGENDGGTSTGGVYSFDVDGTQNTLGIHPGGSDFTPGYFEFRIVNSSGLDLNNFNIAYDLWVNNDQGRGNSLNFFYSTDGINFTAVSDLDFESEEASDANGFVLTEQSAAFSATVTDGSFIYFRFEGNDSTGGGSRDEFAIDNILLTGN